MENSLCFIKKMIVLSLFTLVMSAMREVEALLITYSIYLIKNQDDKNAITPKDIVVMVADIDKYTPYIRSVFGRRCPK